MPNDFIGPQAFSAPSGFIGPPTAPAASAGNWSAAGTALGIGGAMSSAVGAFFQVQNEQSRLKSGALSLEFESTTAAMDARAAERDAQAALIAGQHEVGRLTMSAGAARAARRASTASRGIDLSSASALEVEASGDIITSIDRYTISANAARAAAADRMRAVNARNQSMLSRVSADNMRRSARSMNPWLAASTSLLTDVGRMAAGAALG